MKPPTTSSPGDDARRWREGAAAPRDGVKPPRHRGTPRSHSAVQQPHHAYIGKNGTPDLMVQADKAPMKDNVRPVGATKVMGWPARHLRVLRVAWRRYRAVASMAFDVARLSLSPHAVEAPHAIDATLSP